uniref:Uncharacterized protein n=1 Tax=Knipowitschia caucasica TaxID=637954 RepID=A0AAV2MSW0_KNICA
MSSPVALDPHMSTFVHIFWNLPTDSLDKHQDSQELTTLIEQEVSAMVNRVLSEEQEKGPVMVDSLISSVSLARSMIEKGNSCLKRCLHSLFCSCGLRFAKNNFRSMQIYLEAELLVEEIEPETKSLSSSGSNPDLERTRGYALRTPERTYTTVQNEVSNYLRSLQDYIAQDPLENFYRQDLFELCMEKPPLSPNSQQAPTYNVSIPSQGFVPVQVDFQQLSGHSFNSQKHDLFERYI